MTGLKSVRHNERLAGGGLRGILKIAYLAQRTVEMNFICPTITRRAIPMRTTSDPKNEKIKLRLNEDLKAHVVKYADNDGISLSEYIRELIRQDMRNKRNT